MKRKKRVIILEYDKDVIRRLKRMGYKINIVVEIDGREQRKLLKKFDDKIKNILL